MESTIPNRGSFLGNYTPINGMMTPNDPQSWVVNGMVTMAARVNPFLSESQPPIQAGKSYLIGAPRSETRETSAVPAENGLLRVSAQQALLLSSLWSEVSDVDL